jgi:hypothetical protein
MTLKNANWTKDRSLLIRSVSALVLKNRVAPPDRMESMDKLSCLQDFQSRREPRTIFLQGKCTRACSIALIQPSPAFALLHFSPSRLLRLTPFPHRTKIQTKLKPVANVKSNVAAQLTIASLFSPKERKTLAEFTYDASAISVLVDHVVKSQPVPLAERPPRKKNRLRQMVISLIPNRPQGSEKRKRKAKEGNGSLSASADVKVAKKSPVLGSSKKAPPLSASTPSTPLAPVKAETPASNPAPQAQPMPYQAPAQPAPFPTTPAPTAPPVVAGPPAQPAKAKAQPRPAQPNQVADVQLQLQQIAYQRSVLQQKLTTLHNNGKVTVALSLLFVCLLEKPFQAFQLQIVQQQKNELDQLDQDRQTLLQQRLQKAESDAEKKTIEDEMTASYTQMVQQYIQKHNQQLQQHAAGLEQQMQHLNHQIAQHLSVESQLNQRVVQMKGSMQKATAPQNTGAQTGQTQPLYPRGMLLDLIAVLTVSLHQHVFPEWVTTRRRAAQRRRAAFNYTTQSSNESQYASTARCSVSDSPISNTAATKESSCPS